MPSTTFDAATLERLISAAVAAPSIHNTQPWRYRLDPDTLTLLVRAEPERGLRHTDPAGRALLLSVGASVLNLRVAIAHFGWRPVVRLLPEPADPSLLATVRLAGAPRTGTLLRADLYDAIWRRHSSRFPFSGRPLPAPVRDELEEAALSEGALLEFPERRERQRLLGLTAEAERRNREDADRRDESRGWIHTPAHGGVGLAPVSLGPQDARGRLPLRDFGAHRPAAPLPSQAFERDPVLALLSTAHDRRADWLRAGQALQNVLLVATAHRLRSSLLHQALEWADLRWALAGAVTPVPGRYAQMLLRLGEGPQGPASPRLRPGEVLDFETPESGTRPGPGTREEPPSGG
ncbi:hypothetical protein [Streptomyces sp. ODS28]|uniref:Acg family FMN-binding oxidoreductase n=1 Tax=Streptomyces sp. ODS28 TaxID=3136688 RepID=UPI0031E73AEF